MKLFNIERGFGFITSDGKDYFIHHTEVKKCNVRQLMPGDYVIFKPVEGDKGRIACEIRLD